MDVTTIMYANEINLRSHIPKRMQYDYYLHGIKKQKRYFKYLKTAKEKNLDTIKEYFNYSEKQAKEVLKLFSQKELNEMAFQLNKGGVDGKAR
jgi:preprotein translocase subunit Sec63